MSLKEPWYVCDDVDNGCVLYVQVKYFDQVRSFHCGLSGYCDRRSIIPSSAEGVPCWWGVLTAGMVLTVGITAFYKYLQDS